jgi:hypothetical protein
MFSLLKNFVGTNVHRTIVIAANYTAINVITTNTVIQSEVRTAVFAPK